jgi:hypothetical protein
MERTMRFMMIVKATKDSEAGVMPGEKMLADMTRYNTELVKAGILLEGTGLKPTSQAVRIQYSGDKRLVIDGPFAETNEIIAGYWLINVKSKDEAIEWARRAPNPYGEGVSGYIELRPLFEMEDFGDSAAAEEARKLEREFAKKK